MKTKIQSEAELAISKVLLAAFEASGLRPEDIVTWAGRKPFAGPQRQIYCALLDEVPTLSLESHEIADEVSSEEVVAMWSALKQKHEDARELLRRHLVTRRAADLDGDILAFLLPQRVAPAPHVHLFDSDAAHPDRIPQGGGVFCACGVFRLLSEFAGPDLKVGTEVVLTPQGERQIRSVALQLAQLWPGWEEAHGYTAPNIVTGDKGTIIHRHRQQIDESDALWECTFANGTISVCEDMVRAATR